MRILAIETSGRFGSVAFLNSSLEVRRLPNERDHGEALASVVSELVGPDPELVEAYAVSIGPGSFTGLRVGLSFLKGLAAAIPRPTVSVSSLEALAWSMADVMPDAPFYLPVLDARHQEVYAGLYAASEASRLSLDPKLTDGLYPLESLAERLSGVSVVAGGDLGPEVRTKMASWRWVDASVQEPEAGALLRCAQVKMAENKRCDLSDLEPQYLQKSAAERRLAAASIAGKNPPV